MKRESGENPEQSRCCKLHYNNEMLVLQRKYGHYGRNNLWEGRGTKRSKPEYLPEVSLFYRKLSDLGFETTKKHGAAANGRAENEECRVLSRFYAQGARKA